MESVYIYGALGRIGQVLESYLNSENIPRVKNPRYADIIVLAVPRTAVPELLAKHPQQQILDMSGYCKYKSIGRYGITGWPEGATIVQNVGCFASSVIQAFKRAPFDIRDITGGVHISMMGGASVGQIAQTPQIRLARRLWNHPHLKEIKYVFPDLNIAHFVISLNSYMPHGIWTCIMGVLPYSIASTDPIYGQTVWGTPKVSWSVHAEQQRFVLNVALDNLHFPAYHACMLIKSKHKN